MASRPFESAECRALECLFPRSWSSFTVRAMLAQTSRIAVYGPVRTVVWEGSAGDRRPYPDQDVNMRHPRTAPRGHSSALAAFKIPTIRSESTRRYEYNRIRFQPV